MFISRRDDTPQGSPNTFRASSGGTARTQLITPESSSDRGPWKPSCTYHNKGLDSEVRTRPYAGTLASTDRVRRILAVQSLIGRDQHKAFRLDLEGTLNQFDPSFQSIPTRQLLEHGQISSIAFRIAHQYQALALQIGVFWSE
jgi:hypothetical protein